MVPPTIRTTSITEPSAICAWGVLVALDDPAVELDRNRPRVGPDPVQIGQDRPGPPAEPAGRSPGWRSPSKGPDRCVVPSTRRQALGQPVPVSTADRDHRDRDSPRHRCQLVQPAGRPAGVACGRLDRPKRM